MTSCKAPEHLEHLKHNPAARMKMSGLKFAPADRKKKKGGYCIFGAGADATATYIPRHCKEETGMKVEGFGLSIETLNPTPRSFETLNSKPLNP